MTRETVYRMALYNLKVRQRAVNRRRAFRRTVRDVTLDRKLDEIRLFLGILVAVAAAIAIALL